jgi:serine/threonine protein phosphatase PrpC
MIPSNHRPNTAVYAVFDGHAGRYAAEYVSEHLLKALIDDDLFWSNSSNDVISSLKTNFQKVDDAYLQLCDENNAKISNPYDKNWMCAGTTAVVCIVRGGKLWCVYHYVSF